MNFINKGLSFAFIFNLLLCALTSAKPIHKTCTKIHSAYQETHKKIVEVPTPTDKKIVLQLYQLMKNMHEILLANNITYWVIGGTLLGAVRHKGLIPWDDDLDICINKKQLDNLLALKPIFESLGYEIVYWDNRYDLYRIFPRDTKFPFIDIFLYKQIGNKIFYGWRHFKQPRRDNGVAIYVDELFPRKNYNFGNISVKGPNNPFKYLECCYGSDCLDVAYFGQNHQGKPTQNKKVKLSEKDKTPGEPMGPLKDDVLKILSNSQFSIETINISKRNLKKSKVILQDLLPIFIEAFEKQAESQLKEEHPEEFEALKESGLTIRDVLASRFNKIVETVISQIDEVYGLYISVLKKDTNTPIGYAIFTDAPINKILQSMMTRKYIKFMISLPDDILYSNVSADSDLYIFSIAVLPSFQKQGFGKRLIFSTLCQFPQIKNIYLFAAESKTNIDSQNFYEHLDFERKGIFLTSDDNFKILYCLDRKYKANTI